MTTATVAQPVNFTRADLNAAINGALAKVTDDRWTRAIYRAAANLAAGQFAYDGQQVILRSASSPKVYRIDSREPMQCSCTAHTRGLLCWHIAAARLLVRAAQHAYTAGATNGYQDAPLHPFDDGKPTMAEIQAAADDLFA